MKFIKTTYPSKKLSEKYLGPFEVTNRPGSHSYRINLPDHLRAIHSIFHIFQLEPALPSQIPNYTNLPPPIELDSNFEFKVVEVLNFKLDKQRRDPLLYYIYWSGYENTMEEFSWLTASNLKNAPRLVADFYQCYLNKPGPSLLFLPLFPN